MCLQEHFLGYFSARGYDCVAPSLRGQGGSDIAPAEHELVIRTHAEDVLTMTDENTVIMGHSFGGSVLHW